MKRASLVAILCGQLLVMSGCKIPGLRCAKPAPPQPDYYNWHNGTGYLKNVDSPEWTGANTPSDPAGSAAGNPQATVGQVSYSAMMEVDSKENASPIAPTDPQSFAGLVKAASVLKDPLQNDPNDSAAAPVESSDTLAAPTGSEVVDSGDPVPFFGDSGLACGPEGMAGDLMMLENSAQLPAVVFFDDPFLADLIQQALAGNQELRILAEEIQIANNETYARSGEYRPTVSLGASAGVEKSGRYTRAGAVEEQLEVAPGRGFPDPLPDFLVATNISWELDIWKRLRNAQNAAAMRYLGSQEGRNYVVTRITAEIAENYFELLALDNRLQTLESTIEIWKRSYEVAEANKVAGRGTDLPVRRFQAEVSKTESQKSIIAQEIVEVENRINFLVGRYPQRVERASVNFVDLHLGALSAGIPSQLLQNRGDIRQAEREVAAAGLDVRVARARFYPAVTLTGGLGWNAFSTGYLFQTPESLVYRAAGDIVGPLINKRAIRAAYATANAVQLQRIYDYQQTVLTAHIEVVNYITAVDNYRTSIEAKKQQLESLEASVVAATQLFQSARAEYVEVLLAQRELMEARMSLIETKQQQLSAIVNAYQALGGGRF
ncbi:MAG: TolC family protein [Planctomycetaceae bacterium]